MGESVYRVFGLDRQLYGPVAGEVLREWAGDGRVQRDSWVHRDPGDDWLRAEAVEELASLFPAPQPTVETSPVGSRDATPVSSKSGVPVKVLTRLKLFSGMTPEEMEPFAREMIEQSFRPFTFVVQQGDPGDAMFFLIQGRVGISTRGQVTESFLVSLNIGDTFGEMSLFDPAPRSADVRAENDVVLLKLTATALQSICASAPASANKFLWSVAKLLSARMRAMDRKTAATKDMDAAGKRILPED